MIIEVKWSKGMAWGGVKLDLCTEYFISLWTLMGVSLDKDER